MSNVLSIADRMTQDIGIFREQARIIGVRANEGGNIACRNRSEEQSAVTPSAKAYEYDVRLLTTLVWLRAIVARVARDGKHNSFSIGSNANDPDDSRKTSKAAPLHHHTRS